MIDYSKFYQTLSVSSCDLSHKMDAITLMNFIESKKVAVDWIGYNQHRWIINFGQARAIILYPNGEYYLRYDGQIIVQGHVPHFKNLEGSM